MSNANIKLMKLCNPVTCYDFTLVKILFGFENMNAFVIVNLICCFHTACHRDHNVTVMYCLFHVNLMNLVPVIII